MTMHVFDVWQRKEHEKKFDLINTFASALSYCILMMQMYLNLLRLKTNFTLFKRIIVVVFCAFLSESHGSSNRHKHSTHLKFRPFVCPSECAYIKCMCVYFCFANDAMHGPHSHIYMQECASVSARALKCMHVLHYGYIKIFHRNIHNCV